MSTPGEQSHLNSLANATPPKHNDHCADLPKSAIVNAETKGNEKSFKEIGVKGAKGNDY